MQPYKLIKEPDDGLSETADKRLSNRDLKSYIRKDTVYKVIQRALTKNK